MGAVHRLFIRVIRQLPGFESVSVFGISLTSACSFRVHSEISGCGMRGAGKDWLLMQPMSIYGGCAQAFY